MAKPPLCILRPAVAHSGRIGHLVEHGVTRDGVRVNTQPRSVYPSPSRVAPPPHFFYYLSYHTTHTTTAERRAQKQCRRRGASSGQKVKRGIEGEDPAAAGIETLVFLLAVARGGRIEVIRERERDATHRICVAELWKVLWPRDTRALHYRKI